MEKDGPQASMFWSHVENTPLAVQSGQDVLAAQLSNLSRKLQVQPEPLELSVPSFCLRTSPLRSTTSDNLFEGGPRPSHL